MLNKFLRVLGELSWTLAGTALVLITLSGDTRRMGIYISAVGLAVYLVALLGEEE
jgi:hypothetical protein